jgi:hypothetical protein
MPVDDDTRQKIKTDDVELFKFGVQWLKSVLFKRKDPLTGEEIGD